ncbi:MAG: threonine synthase, partial [Eubacteriales bacterium]
KPEKFSLDKINTKAWNLFRYANFMALEDDTWQSITLGEGMTPIVNFDDHVMLKMDYMMPTLSFKDRGAAVLVSHCKSIGVTSVVQDSSGNAGNSVAAYAAKAGIDCQIFVPEGTSPKKIAMIESHGASVEVVPGSRDHCADVCRGKVEAEGAYYANHVYNPYFYEGTKTYIYEIYEQLGRIPEHLFIPLGNGTLFIGAVLALEHLLDSGVINHFPKILAVQSTHCDPFVQAYLNKSPEPAIVEPKPTMAEGIAIGIPMRGKEILEMVYRHNMEVIVAPEETILAARLALAEQGVYCEHTTAASYAAYLAYCEKNGPTPDSLLSMCGAGLKSDK